MASPEPPSPEFDRTPKPGGNGRGHGGDGGTLWPPPDFDAEDPEAVVRFNKVYRGLSAVGELPILPFDLWMFRHHKGVLEVLDDWSARVWKVIQDLPPEKREFLERYEGRVRDLRIFWWNWEQYSPEEQEAFLKEQRRRAHDDEY